MNKKYLPIGTICKLKESKKEVMIIGYYPALIENSNIIYDYSACTYPEGFLSSDLIIGFNVDDIEKIIKRGLKTDIYEKYIQEIKKTEKQSSNTVTDHIELLDI